MFLFDEVAMSTKIQRALISVPINRVLFPLFSSYLKPVSEIISTGGTARSNQAFQAIELVIYTGFLRYWMVASRRFIPKFMAVCFTCGSIPEHCATVDQHQIKPIDLVVDNLYPFEATIAKPDVTLDEAIENIDIGGPSMLRAPPRITECHCCGGSCRLLKGG